MKNETYLGLVGKWFSNGIWVAEGLWRNEGTPVSVKFNAQDIIDREKHNRDVIGFYHTHPGMVGRPSLTDITTMNSWVDCLGKPLICLIDGADGLNCYYWHFNGFYKRSILVKRYISGLFTGTSTLIDFSSKKEEKEILDELKRNFSPRRTLSGRIIKKAISDTHNCLRCWGFRI